MFVFVLTQIRGTKKLMKKEHSKFMFVTCLGLLFGKFGWLSIFFPNTESFDSGHMHGNVYSKDASEFQTLLILFRSL